MIRKADNFIIETFDKGTTFIQRRGILPLNTLLMGASCLFWSSNVAAAGFGWATPFIIGVGAMGLYYDYKKWKDDYGYWLNQRKTLFLNAVVAMEREYISIRLLTISTFIPLMLVFIYVLYLSNLISCLTLIVWAYLKCCHYLGPGDYAKQRQTKLSGVPEMQ